MKSKRLPNIHSVLVLLFLLSSFLCFGQCTGTISSFPYTEDFESTAAWTSGGTNSDWAWGTPANTAINSAGSGSKCWVAGGLTGNSYNDSEQSWLMSPCFDFTTLSNPHISFLIYWECEFRYDGMVLQYSTNGGTSWSNVGAYGDATDCLNQNWYNYQNINWLTTASPKHGWTGRTGATQGSCQGGNGSNGWVEASHCLALGGNPSVRFRFLFGSGTTCNSYAGIAIDRFHIENVEPLALSVSNTCQGSNLFQFQVNSNGCPSFLWNFGEPSTGVINNTSSSPNPSHTYQNPGLFNVTVTASGACYTTKDTTFQVYVYDANLNLTNTACNANTGQAVAVIDPPNAAAQFAWNNNPATSNAIFDHLASGSYSLVIAAPNACSTQLNFVIDPASAPALTVSAVNPSCANQNNGSAIALATLGTPPYSFAWSNGNLSASADSLAPGNYTCTVTDQNGCTASAQAAIVDPLPLTITASATATTCGQDNGAIVAQANGGSGSTTITLQPFYPNWNSLPAGTYTLNALDNNGCTAQSDIVVDPSVAVVVNLAETTDLSCQGANNGQAVLTANINNVQWIWSPPVASTASASQLSAGEYTVSAIANGVCSDTVSFVIHEPPALTAVITPAQSTICEGHEATLQSTVAGGTSPYSYSWSAGGTGSSISFFPTASQVVTLSVNDANGCSISANTTLEVVNPSTVQITATDSICEGRVATIQTSGSGLVQWPDNTVAANWSFRTSQDSLVPMVVGFNTLCPLDTSVLVHVIPRPDAQFALANSPLEFTPVEVSFTNLSLNTTSWQWNFGDGQTSIQENPAHAYLQEGSYTIWLTVTNAFGCTDSTYKFLTVGAQDSDYALFIPNAFTPDNDGINDVLKIEGYGLTEFSMIIFNRWGERVFQTDTMSGVWVGEMNGGVYFVPDGIYNWIVRAKTGGAEWIERRGSILVVR